MVDLQLLETIGVIAAAMATIALVALLYKTIKQMEASVHLSKIQTEYRFRPWIGPNNSIKQLKVNGEGKHRFDIAIRNYGEIPAQYVKAYYKMDTKMISRDVLKTDDLMSFNLGPMLPNMEKHYWFFIDCDLIDKAKEGKEKVFIILYFEYPVSGGKSGYGMISQYTPDIDGFAHKDMWVESPKGLDLDKKI